MHVGNCQHHYSYASERRRNFEKNNQVTNYVSIESYTLRRNEPKINLCFFFFLKKRSVSIHCETMHGYVCALLKNILI